MHSKKTLYPKMVVPAIPYNNGIRFLMDSDQIDIGGEHADNIWKIIANANGFNDIKTIASETQLPVDYVEAIVLDLLTLNIMYDAHNLYEHFHAISKSPDLYPQCLNYEDVLALQSKKRKSKKGDLLDYTQNNKSPLSQLIFHRKSCRLFSDEELDVDLISNICYHAYSIPMHAVPSGGALYPLKLYVLVEKKQGSLEEGYYEYDSIEDKLRRYKSDIDKEQLLYCFNDIKLPFNSNVQIIITADFDRETSKYSNRGYRLALIEAGHVAQNICLYCTENDLGCCELGGVLDDELSNEIELDSEVPVLSIAIGKSSDITKITEIDPVFLAGIIEKKYVGDNKPIKNCTGLYLGKNASFFAAYSDFGQDNDSAGATSTSFYMAKTKAIIEGYERYVSEHPVADLICAAEEIDNDWLDPNTINPMTKECIERYSLSHFSEKLVLPWKKSEYLVSHKTIYVPVDLVYYGEYETKNRICYSNSSGIAAHTLKEEAIKNALMELIERDAIMRNWYQRKSPMIINKHRLSNHIRKRINKYEKEGRKVLVLDMESQFAPTIQVIITGNKYPFFVSGAAANMNPEVAVLKAMAEAEYALYSLQKNHFDDVIPEQVSMPADHGSLYASGKYISNIKWLMNGEVRDSLPKMNLTYSDLVKLLNPVVTELIDDGTICVVRVFSSCCLPINFGYKCDSIAHPVMNNINYNKESVLLPHYFA